MHGELDRELRGGGDVFVAVQALGQRHVRASRLYIVAGAAWLHGALPETAGRSLEDADPFGRAPTGKSARRRGRGPPARRRRGHVVC